MALYLQIIKFNFLRFFTYPLEMLVGVSQKLIEVAFLVIFWSLVLEKSTIDKDITKIISYFLISSSISTLTMSMNTNVGRSIRKQVKSGEINNILVKPVNLITYYYSYTFGNLGIRIIISIIAIFFGIFFAGNVTLVQFFFFLILLFLAIIVSLSFNIFEGALALVFTEVSGIKNSINHISRVLSGALVPLTFFPETIRSIIELLPFSVMIFGPASALSGIEEGLFLKQVLIGVFWAVFLNFSVFYFWKWALKKYEAIGI